MGETKWTPGPWEVGGSGILVWQGSTIVADMRPDIEEAEAIVPSEEAEANAHLISAAPEMYEALTECVEILTKIYRGEPVAGLVLDAVDSGRAALRKADGNNNE